MNTSLSVVNFVKALVERLMLSNRYDSAKLGGLLTQVRGELSKLYTQNEVDVPEGAETARDLLLEAFELYDNSLAQVEEFLESQEEAHLINAVALADEAHDVVLAAEDVVKHNKRLLADMVTN